jgi:hypothetical protein
MIDTSLDITIEQNPKLGFYTVGDKVFYSKPLALIESTQTGHFPHWNFNNKIFGDQPWTEEPETDLQELYRRRALQLREQYDYIRLELSGGADGNTALYSFVLNGIHIDEVVFRYPKTGEKNVSADPFNTKPENTLSEWEYACKPTLEWLRINAPKTLITIHDYSVDMLAGKHDESWVFYTRDYFQPGHRFKHTVDAVKEHKILLERDQRICMLWGVDKPKVCVKDQKWYLYFMDIQANAANPDIKEYTNITNEYFFWSPDMPDLIRKQAHTIKNWFNLENNKYLQHLVRWPNYSFAQRTTFEHIVKPLIYPDYDPTTFQTSKPTNSFYNEMDHWFYTNFQDTDVYSTWQAGLNVLTKNIDPKFFNKEIGRPVGFVGFLSPFYELGDAHFVDSGRNIHHKF